MHEWDNKSEDKHDNDYEVNKMTMDDKGKIRNRANGTVALGKSSRLFIILGWVSTALAAFVSPIFAIAGIIFGVLLNRKVKGQGNMIIITSVVLGLAKFVLGYIFLTLY